MRYAVGYDRDFSKAFFKRSVSAARCKVTGFKLVEQNEVDYLSDRFAETTVIPLSNDLAFPRHKENIEELVKAITKKPNRRLLQMAETEANFLLFLEGFNAFGGLRVNSEYDADTGTFSPPRPILPFIQQLYAGSARGSFRTKSEILLLNRLARHTEIWLRILGTVPGSDCMELFSDQPSFLVLSSEN